MLNIDTSTIILMTSTIAAYICMALAAWMLLSVAGSWRLRLSLLGSLWNAILFLLGALYLIASYMLPENSVIHDWVVDLRLMYVAIIVATVVGAVCWRLAIRWSLRLEEANPWPRSTRGRASRI